MIDLLNLLPRKPTCPLKINGWKMYIFPIEIVPFLADMLVFRGVNLQFTGVLHPNECHESFLKHQLMSGCFPVGASLNHCCRHFFRMGRWELARNIGRVQKTWSFWRKKGDKYGIIYIYMLCSICGKICTRHSMWTKIHGNYAIYFYLYLRLLHEKNQKYSGWMFSNRTGLLR